MAAFRVDGIDGLDISLQEIAQMDRETRGSILEAGAAVVMAEQVRIGESYGVHRTGVTLSSIALTKKMYNSDNPSVDITFEGNNADGNRNAEVAFINNYGAPKKKIDARPFITDANINSAEKATEAEFEVYDRWLKMKGL